jgi:hypothetical protein
MGCSCAGLVAIIVVGVATVLNIVSFALPMWSTSSISETSGGKEVSADFTAGVYAYCTNIKGSTKDSGSLDEDEAFSHCFEFHSSSKFNNAKLNAINSKLAEKLSSKSVCEGYSDASDSGKIARMAFSGALATNAHLDSTAFDQFLDKACSGLGVTNIVLSFLACLTGALTFVFLILGVTCCKNRSCFNVLCKVLVVITFLLETIVFILWIVEARPINKLSGVGFSGCFIVSVIAAFLFMISIILVQRHIHMHSSN